MKKKGVFIDPVLGKDRFDFGGESLTEDDVSEYRDQAGAEDITKGAKECPPGQHKHKIGSYSYCHPASRKHSGEEEAKLDKVQSKIKEPWQMTAGKFIDSRKGTPFELEVFEAKDIHRGVIKQALAEGKKVPAEVLAEYPNIDIGKFITHTHFYGHKPESVDRGGNFKLSNKAGKEIGHASAVFEHKNTEYAFSGKIPAHTMVIDSIELYDESRRGKGVGTAFLNHIEDQARKAGMVRAYAVSVMGPAEDFWASRGYEYSDRGRIWIKEFSEELTKGKKIAHQPGYRFDEQKHKWVSIEDKVSEAKKFSIDKKAVDEIINISPVNIFSMTQAEEAGRLKSLTKGEKRIREKIDALKDSISITRREVMGDANHFRGAELAYDWSEGLLFRIVGLRQIVADIEGINYDKKASIEGQIRALKDEEPSKDAVKAIIAMSDFSFVSFDEKTQRPTKKPVTEVIKEEHAFTKKATRQIYGDTLDVWRCVYGDTAKDIIRRIKHGDKVELEDSPLSSYTTDRVSAQLFASTVAASSTDAFIFHKTIKSEDVYFAWYANAGMLLMPEQKEIVISTKDKFNIDKDSIDWTRDLSDQLERVESVGEFEYEEDITKGKPIAHQPGYYFDRQEHRWKKTHAREGAPEHAPVMEFQKATPSDFHKALSQSKRLSFLSDYNKSELSSMDLHLREDGEVGYAIKEGFIANLFNNDGEGAGAEAMIDAIASGGGNNLDCFDGFLTEYYKTFGFKVKETEKWDDEYAPKDWNYESYGRPDIIFMEYGGKNRDAAAIRDYRNKRLKEYESVADVHKALSMVLEKAKPCPEGYHKHAVGSYAYCHPVDRKHSGLDQKYHVEEGAVYKKIKEKPLKDWNVQEKIDAIRELGLLGSDDKKAQSMLGLFMNDDFSQVREEVVRHIGDESIGQMIENELGRDNKEFGSTYVLRALVRRADKENLHKLAKSVVDTDTAYLIIDKLAEVNDQEGLGIFVKDELASVRTRAALHLDQKGLHDMLRKDAKSYMVGEPSDTVLHQIAMRIDQAGLIYMLHDKDAYEHMGSLIRYAIARRIGKHKLWQMFDDPSSEVREMVFKRMDKKDIDRALDLTIKRGDRDHNRVLESLVPFIDKEGLHKMLAIRGSEAEKRFSMVSLADMDDRIARVVDQEGLRKMVDTKSVYTRRIVAERIEDQASIHKLKDDEDEFVRSSTAKKIDQEGLHAMINREFENAGVLYVVAGRIDQEGLHQMAEKWESPTIKMEVARRIDQAGLHKLKWDDSADVRTGVARRIDQKGLHMMINDDNGATRKHVAGRINQAGLHKMVKDESVGVRKVVVSHIDQKGLAYMRKNDSSEVVRSHTVDFMDSKGLEKVMKEKEPESDLYNPAYMEIKDAKIKASFRLGSIKSLGGDEQIAKFYKTGKFDISGLSPEFRDTIRRVDGSDVTANQSYGVFDELFKRDKCHSKAREEWLGSSTSGFAGILKDSVMRQFGTGKTVYHRGSSGEYAETYAWDEEIDNAMLDFGVNREDVDKYVRNMKGLTKQLLDIRFPNQENLTIYRGTGYTEAGIETFKKSKKIKLNQNPISSWSYKANQAAKFGNVVLTTTVPKDRIWTSFLNYSHSGFEGEMVLIGKEGQTAIARNSSDVMY